MMMECQKCKSAMNPFCRSLSGEVREQLCKRGKKVVINASGVPYQLTYRPTVLVIQEGLAAQCACLESGSEVGVSFVGSGSVVWPIPDVGGRNFEKAFDSVLKILLPVSGCVFSMREIEALYSGNIGFSRAIVSSLASEQAIMAQHCAKLLCMSSEEKVRYLFSIFKENGVPLNALTHNEIAQLLNLNRFTVTKSIKAILNNWQ